MNKMRRICFKKQKQHEHFKHVRIRQKSNDKNCLRNRQENDKC